MDLINSLKKITAEMVNDKYELLAYLRAGLEKGLKEKVVHVWKVENRETGKTKTEIVETLDFIPYLSEKCFDVADWGGNRWLHLDSQHWNFGPSEASHYEVNETETEIVTTITTIKYTHGF